MHYCKLIIITIILLIGSTDLAHTEILEPGRIEDDIRELLYITKAEKLADQMLDQILYAYEKMVPEVPKEIWENARKEMRVTEFVDLVVPIYAKHFNRSDIRELISFYKSPIGKKFIAKQGDIVKESMAVGMMWGQEAGKRIEEKLKSKGYKVPNTL